MPTHPHTCVNSLTYHTQNSGTLTPSSPSNTYILAQIFSLAHPYGTPTVLSSYSFSDTNAGPPNGGYGPGAQGGGATGWRCQHRLPEVAGMVSFRNAVGTAGMTNWVAPSGQRIAFGRGACCPELGSCHISIVAWT